MSPVTIIAEAGVNHNGSLDLALKLVDAAAEVGADVVKFQTFRASSVVTPEAEKASYQKKAAKNDDETAIAMLERLELPRNSYCLLKKRCDDLGLVFMSTPFDVDSLDFLVNNIGMKRVKIPSGEITNGPFLLEVARRAEEIVLSTGMSSLAEVEMALKVLAWGRQRGDERPESIRALQDSPLSDALDSLCNRITLLHCTTEYPAPISDVNLRAMDTLRTAFGLPVGYSDHTEGIAVPIAAVARGATVIEKHLTLDRTLPGPDHQASMEPREMKSMVSAIRDVENALGSPIKDVAASEIPNRTIVRRRLVANQPISAGAPIAAGSLSAKRPATGRSPMEAWDLIGQTASRNYDVDETL